MTSPTVADPVLGARLADLTSVVDALAADVLDGGASRWSEGDLGAAVTAMEVLARRMLAVQAAVVGDAVGRGTPASAGCKDGAQWLRSLVNLAPGEAARRVEVGASLLRPQNAAGPVVDADLVPAQEALLAGGITFEHARTLVQGAGRLSVPEVPPGAIRPEVRTEALRVLVEQATRLDPRQLQTLTRRLTVQLDPAGDDRLARDETRQAAYRGLTMSRTRNGMVHLSGLLTPVCAGLLATAIDAGSAPAPAADGTPDDRTAAMRRHDSLHALMERVVAADGMLPTTHGAAYRLLVTVPSATVQAALTGPRASSAETAQPALLPDGWPVSSQQLGTLVCDAELVPVLVDEHSQPLDVGATQYLFPPRIRTAIITRDRGCTWPGCGAPPSWCHTHHLQPFRTGGPTSVDNGTLLCGRHHRHVHRHGQQAQLREGTVHWNTGPPGLPDNEAPASATIVNRLITHLADRNRAGPSPEPGAGG